MTASLSLGEGAVQSWNWAKSARVAESYSPVTTAASEKVPDIWC